MCVRNWKQAAYGVSKANIWLKTKLRIDPESLGRESMHRWIDVFLSPLNNMIIEPAFGTFGTLPREVPWLVAQEK